MISSIWKSVRDQNHSLPYSLITMLHYCKDEQVDTK